jgi:hypothetical protein
MDACPCCVHDDDQAKLRSRPLRELTADDLEHYVWKAMSTWGDANDFRHFLPRVLELATGHPDDLFGTEIVLGKLGYATWWGWPKPERDAVEDVLWLRWTSGLALDPSEFDADAWLCGASLARVDGRSYVDAWRTCPAPAAFAHLAEFLTSNPDPLTKGRLANAFYPASRSDDRSRTAEGVAVAMREWLTECMADPGFQSRLAAWYEEEYGRG